jgi:integrating conjugative element protein (TIGR03755 family)
MNLDARKEPAMTDRIRRLLQTVALGLALAGLPLTAPAQLPSSPDLSWLYYEIGGGRGYWAPPNPNVTSVTIGAGAELGLGYSCSTFDPILSVTNMLNQLSTGFDQMSAQMAAAANAAIAALPAYILQRANPGLYDLFQNALLRAEETLSLATKTCEQMEAEIARGHDPFHEWVVLSKGHSWRRAMGTPDGDIVQTKEDIDTERGRPGVPWLGGGRQGGAGQDPIRTVEDVVRAGYNITAQRPPAAVGPAYAAGDPTAPPMARHWTSPEAAANWAVQVLGDENIATCFEADCPDLRSTPGMGLTRQVESERDVLFPELVDLIGGATPLTAANLERFSAGGVSLTPALVQAIRELPPAERGIAVGRMSDELAVGVNVERALYVRRFLLAGRLVPEISAAGPVGPILQEKVVELEREIDNTLFESRIRRELVSATSQALLGAEADRRARSSVLAPAARPEAFPLEGGAVPFP